MTNSAVTVPRQAPGTHPRPPAPWKVSRARGQAGGGQAWLQAGEGTPSKDALIAQASPPGEVLTILRGCPKSDGHSHRHGPHKALGSCSRAHAEAGCDPRCLQRSSWEMEPLRPCPLPSQRSWAPQPPLAQPPCLALSSLQM